MLNDSIKIEELRKLCQLRGRVEGRVSRFYQKFSIYITKSLIIIGVSANQVTFLMILIGVIGILFLARGEYLYAVFGGLLLQMSHILDYVDGEIARYHKKKSLEGLFLDIAYHGITKSGFFIGVSFGLYNFYPYPLVFLLGALATISFVTGSYLLSYSEWIREEDKGGSDKNKFKKDFETEGKYLLIRNISKKVLILWNSFALWWLVFIAALADQLFLFLLFYAIATPIWLVYVLYYLCRGKYTFWKT